MANRKENFVENEYYHVYNRGNSRQNIFLDDHDKDRFIKLLYLCNSTKNFNFRNDIVNPKISAYDFDKEDDLVSIGAWILMPNHYHLYITPSPRLNLGDGENSVSLFMSKLSTAYSMYFNKKYERTGSLFESRFKSKHIYDDNHAKYNFSYIHLNCIKLIDSSWKEEGIKNLNKASDFLNKYKWSSYMDYIGVIRSENKILNKKDFPDYFSNKRIFDEEIFEWLNFKELS